LEAARFNIKKECRGKNEERDDVKNDEKEKEVEEKEKEKGKEKKVEEKEKEKEVEEKEKEKEGEEKDFGLKSLFSHPKPIFYRSSIFTLKTIFTHMSFAIGGALAMHPINVDADEEDSPQIFFHQFKTVRLFLLLFFVPLLLLPHLLLLFLLFLFVSLIVSLFPFQEKILEEFVILFPEDEQVLRYGYGSMGTLFYEDNVLNFAYRTVRSTRLRLSLPPSLPLSFIASFSPSFPPSFPPSLPPLPSLVFIFLSSLGCR